MTNLKQKMASDKIRVDFPERLARQFRQGDITNIVGYARQNGERVSRQTVHNILNKRTCTVYQFNIIESYFKAKAELAAA